MQSRHQFNLAFLPPVLTSLDFFLLHMVERCHKLDPKVRSQYESELLWHRIWGPCPLQFPASSSASFVSSRALPACTCLMRWHPNSCRHETKEEIISDCCTSHERFLRKIGTKIDAGIRWEASEVGLRVLKIIEESFNQESQVFALKGHRKSDLLKFLLWFSKFRGLASEKSSQWSPVMSVQRNVHQFRNRQGLLYLLKGFPILTGI